jgi:hypothetical protein
VKFRSTAVGAAAAAAALAAILAPYPLARTSAHPAARWSATWASAMQPPVAGHDDTTGPNWSDGLVNWHASATAARPRELPLASSSPDTRP